MKKSIFNDARAVYSPHKNLAPTPNAGVEEDKVTPEFNIIVSRLENLTSLQRDYIFAIKKKLDNLSYIGGIDGDGGEERSEPVTINEKLNEQLDHQESNAKQLEIMLNFLNKMV